MQQETLTYLESANARKAHIHAAIAAAGGNKAVAQGCDVAVNAPAQWKLSGAVPAAHCAKLAELSGGLFKPAQVRRNWAVEHEAIRELAAHAAG